jgi:hypothetical protein
VKVTQEDTLYHCNGLGLFKIDGHKSSTLRVYREGTDQSVLMPNTFAFQNYLDEDYFAVSYEKAFKSGTYQDVTVMAFGIPGILPHQGRVKVTQVTKQAVWLYDEGASLVYVFKPNEE